MSREQINQQTSDDDEDDEEQWEVLRDHPDYEICREYPYQIRKISTHRILKESTQTKGYLQVSLSGIKYLKHRLVALQWIDNPDNLPFVDHINGVKTDNRLDNLRWVTHLQNSNNNHTYKDRMINYVNELPDNAVVIEQYNNRYEFEGLYFHGDVFYVDTGNGNYRIIPSYMNQGYRKVGLRDIHGVRRVIMYDRLLHQYGLD